MEKLTKRFNQEAKCKRDNDLFFFMWLLLLLMEQQREVTREIEKCLNRAPEPG